MAWCGTGQTDKTMMFSGGDKYETGVRRKVAQRPTDEGMLTEESDADRRRGRWHE